MKKKLFIPILFFIVIIVLLFFLGRFSGYKNIMSDQSTKHGSEKTVNLTSSSEDNLKKFDRSKEDIAIDQKISQQRKQNEKTYKEDGIGGTFVSGSGLAPKRTRDDFINIIGSLSKYIDEHPDIYPKYEEFSDEKNVGVSVDPRFEELIYGKCKEKNSLIADVDKSDLIVMEARRLDGNYDDILMKRNSNGSWEIFIVGNYYSIKNELLK